MEMFELWELPTIFRT